MARDVARFLYLAVLALLEVLCLPMVLALALAARLAPRPVDVGLGPEPLINNIYHKRALEQVGYTAETFTLTGTHIRSDFDVIFPRLGAHFLGRLLLPYWLFVRALFRYKALFIYFHGGPLMLKPVYGWLEPYFYRLAGMPIVVMPYGSDVQDLTRTRNLLYRHAVASDYPLMGQVHARISRNIDRWSRHASWVISGCDWVDYMYYWNTLMSGHFSIDTAHWSLEAIAPPPRTGETFRVLHAPNHVHIKGTHHVQQAVERLRAEGLDIELVLLRGVPNAQIREAIASVDLVADQFVVGWYAMFAIEAMALQRPVLCYLRDDLSDLFIKAEVLAPGELPLIPTDMLEIEQRLRWAYHHRQELRELGRRGREFVERHHSTEAVGAVFADILARLGMTSHAPSFTTHA